jgi:asparagine synthase (glutamine-hydrolysing)
VSRYIALVWNAQSPAEASRAEHLRSALLGSGSQWTELLREAGMAALYSGSRGTWVDSYKLPAGHGIVLGRLFPTDMNTWSADWHPQFTEADVRTFHCDPADSFVRRYWGSYIAMFRDSAGTHCQLLRDCSGKLPCYRIQRDGVHILFSDVADLKMLGISNFDIDWQFLSAFIHSSTIQTRRTAMVGVTELLAGEALEFKGNSVHQYSAWDPRAIVRSGFIPDYDEAKELLRSTTQFCVDAWSSVYHNVILQLSGGLDSAVVLGSLVRSSSRPNVTCLNCFSNNAEDDERVYARLAADVAGVRMIEVPRAPEGEKLDLALTQGQTFPRPNIQAMFGLADLDIHTRLAAELNADSSWTGQGGDHLFYQTGSSLGAADFVSQHGLGLGVVRAIQDAARLSREPYWLVARSALKLGRNRTAWSCPGDLPHLALEDGFVDADSLPKALEAYTSNDWAVNVSDIPKGKQFQIRGLAELLNRHRPIPHIQPVEYRHPLISQPLIELCLRIPTYNLLRGGRDRALARDTFEDRVPAEILMRQDKGGASAHIVDSLRRRESFIRSLLLEGLLAQRKILRRSALEPYLVHGQSIRAEHFWPLLACIAAELWVRAWSGSGARSAV